MRPTLETLRGRIRDYPDDTLRSLVRNITAAGARSPEERMVRAALLDVYAERHGPERADALMEGAWRANESWG